MNVIAIKVIRFIFISFFLLFASRVGDCQTVSVSPDSSQIIFPNNVSIRISKSTEKNSGGFVLDHRALKTLLVQSNYILAKERQSRELSQLLRAEVGVKDSAQKILQKQLIAEQERVKNFSTAYDELRLTATTYDKQMRTLINDLAHLKKINRRQRRKSFVKGMLTGVASATVVSIFVLIRN